MFLFQRQLCQVNFLQNRSEERTEPRLRFGISRSVFAIGLVSLSVAYPYIINEKMLR
jgi:hypothetical protein